MRHRVEVVVKVHCGTVLGDEFAAMLKMRPPKQSHNAPWQPSRPGLPRNSFSFISINLVSDYYREHGVLTWLSIFPLFFRKAKFRQMVRIISGKINFNINVKNEENET